ncbi:MAG TPA: tetratricopeptide repeat protein [Chitinophagales bacterium]|nr:tetratricopeptide repeat protein [Chitinophagales bacterium]
MKKIFLVFSSLVLALGTLQAQNCARYINGDSLKTTPAYSIYREFFKKGMYDDAFPQWKNMYNNAPGFRKQTFLDGVVMYTSLIQKTTDNSLRQTYIDTLFQIYNKQIQCHGEDEYVLGKKAIDLLKYGKNADIPEARKCLEKTLALTGNKAFPYYIQTYYKLLINQIGKDGITADFVIGKYDELSAIVDKNIADVNNKQLQAYKDVKVVLDDLYTQNFADKSDPADCAKLVEIYLKKYKENPNDIETIKSVYAKTKGCTDSATNVELLKKLNELAPNYTYATRLANIYVKNKQFDDAIILYQNALAKETDSIKKSDLNYYMAFMKYAKEDFPASRDLAKEAINFNAKNIRAYNLIATLYLSSGPLCGPGTGFQSQIVLWPAFDYFNKVIEIGGDDEVVEEAKKYIADYTKYLPTKAEITAKKLSVGGPYTVKCWINEETTVKVK